MQPSKMNDEQLRLAIAEELGWLPSFKSIAIEKSAWPYKWLSPDGVGADPPDYPGDIAAAMRLLDEFKYWQITNEDGWISVHIYGDYLGEDWLIAGLEGRSPLAKIICEAWLTARSNHG